MKLLKDLSIPNNRPTIAAANNTGNNLPILLLIYVNKWGGVEILKAKPDAKKNKESPIAPPVARKEYLG